MPDLGRNPDPIELGKGPALEPPAPAPPGAGKLAASAVATLDMEVPPEAKVQDAPDLGSDAPAKEAQAPAASERESPAKEGPAPAQPEGPAPESRSVNELAKDPATRADLEKALTDGRIQFDSLKNAVKAGLETGDFKFKTAGQERVVKEIIAGTIQPTKAPAAEGPAAAPSGPEAAGPAPDPAPKASALDRAIESIPNGIDKRVEAALRESPEVMAAKNPAFTKGAILTAKPGVGDAVRYANAIAVKTENFDPKSIVTDFQTAMSRTNKGSLYDLANDQGVQLYPKSRNAREGAAPRDPNTVVEPESAYGRAITAAREKGVALPAPADPEKGYTVGEARQMTADKLLDLDSVARARQTPAPGPAKELAGPEDRKVVLDAITKGVDGKPGLPKDTYMSLSNPARNEVRNIVKGLGAPNADLTSMVVTAVLAKELKDRLEKEASAPSA